MLFCFSGQRSLKGFPPACSRSSQFSAALPEQTDFVLSNHEHFNFKGGKFSKSRGAAVDVPYFLSKYDPDPPRFYLTAPETRDTEACPETIEMPALRDPKGTPGRISSSATTLSRVEASSPAKGQAKGKN
jgi:hypothetical protein